MNRIVEKESTYFVKGIEITFLEKILLNQNNEEVFSEELEQQNDITLFNAYREKVGLLMPEEIKKIRMDLNLTADEFNSLLSLEKGSVERLENGTLQSFTLDKSIRNL